jgi:hypothetical protein
MTAAATADSTSSGDIPSKGWMARATANLKELAPYAILELVLPGGSLMAILLWLYRRRLSRRGVGLPTRCIGCDF